MADENCSFEFNPNISEDQELRPRFYSEILALVALRIVYSSLGLSLQEQVCSQPHLSHSKQASSQITIIKDPNNHSSQ
jgi:hypothetical protein